VAAGEVRIIPRLAELGVAEVAGYSTSPRESGTRKCSVESPDVEVLYTIATIYVMQSRTLTESRAQHTVGQSRIPRLPSKEVLAIRTSYLGESSQVRCSNGLV
jgi:hypothetical protein